MNWKILAVFAFVYTFHFSSSAQIFSEQSSALGIDHSYQARGLMGGGAAFFDFDQDGDEDLYLTGGLSGDVIYRNEGNGSFTKTGTNLGLEATIQHNTTAVITGDIDNDGDRDIFVSTWETFVGGTDNIARNLLFENKGDGSFEEIGTNAGITQTAFSIGANFVDYNKDGFIDIHVMNHVETPKFLYDSMTGAIIGFDHDCFDNFLYRNNGDKTFTEVGSQQGINDSGCALAALPSDYDMDGDQDIFIANDFGPFIVPNVLYQNNFPSDGFMDVSAATGAGIPMYGMGIAAGDYDHDLDFDYYITNLGKNVLLENDNGVFTDVATSADVESTYAVGSTTDFATGWGTAFFDVDNDSWLDLFVANGRIPSLSTLPTAMNDPNKLYLNNGDKTFTDISDINGVADPLYSRGMAYSDFDKDGDLDFVVVNQSELGGKVNFYVNGSTDGNHYVDFKLKGKESNFDAYGSKIWLYAGGQIFLREVDGGGGSFCSQSSSVVHFGLGTVDQIDSVQVEWINGHVDHLGTFAIDARHEIEEGIVSSALDRNNSNFALRVMPNPFQDNFTITIDGDWQEQISLDLIALDGKVLARQEGRFDKGSILFKTNSDLPAGLYTLRLRGKTQTLVEKVVKH